MTTLGIDTSNYTTSAAVWHDGEMAQARKLLPVKENGLGLRQSDAVFLHTKQFSEVFSQLDIPPTLDAIGVSDRPCSREGSYMPCFLVGKTLAETIGKVTGAKVKTFTHQQGHMAAGLYSAGRLDLLYRDFLALHVSGGTTELLKVNGTCAPLEISIIGGSLDLKAGQAVDRVGRMLGLPFPAGRELEKLALQSDAHFKIKPCVKDFNLSLSGVENQCAAMLKRGESRADVALFCLKSLSAALCRLTQNVMQTFPGLPILFVGGVMSDSILREDLSFCGQALFASPQLSSDNACGTAILAERL